MSPQRVEIDKIRKAQTREITLRDLVRLLHPVNAALRFVRFRQTAAVENIVDLSHRDHVVSGFLEGVQRRLSEGLECVVVTIRSAPEAARLRSDVGPRDNASDLPFVLHRKLSCNLAAAVQLVEAEAVLVRRDLQDRVRRCVDDHAVVTDLFFTELIQDLRAAGALVSDRLMAGRPLQRVHQLLREACVSEGLEGCDGLQSRHFPVAAHRILAAAGFVEPDPVSFRRNVRRLFFCRMKREQSEFFEIRDIQRSRSFLNMAEGIGAFVSESSRILPVPDPHRVDDDRKNAFVFIIFVIHFTHILSLSLSLHIRNTVRLRSHRFAHKQDQDDDRKNVGQHRENFCRNVHDTSAENDSQRLSEAEYETRKISVLWAPASEDNRRQRDKALTCDGRLRELGDDAQRDARAGDPGENPRHDHAQIAGLLDVDTQRIGSSRIFTDSLDSQTPLRPVQHEPHDDSGDQRDDDHHVDIQVAQDPRRGVAEDLRQLVRNRQCLCRAVEGLSAEEQRQSRSQQVDGYAGDRLVREKRNGSRRVQQPHQAACNTRAQQADPRISAEISDGRAGKSAHCHHPFDADVDDSGAFRYDTAQRPENQRRRVHQRNAYQ